jgi:very-short-patch-repair endonuclease
LETFRSVKTYATPTLTLPPQGGGDKMLDFGGLGDMPDLVGLSRNLRKNQTDAENKLWRHLRGKQLEGLRFRRQHPIGRYIVDFVCLEKRLVLEIDGGQHGEEKGQIKDKERDQCLRSEGYQVLRFWNNEVLTNLEGVMDMIRANVLPDSEE